MKIIGILLPIFITDDDAKQLLEKELSKPEYAEKNVSWWYKILEYINNFIISIFNNEANSGNSFIDLIIITLFIIVVVLIVLIITKIKKNHPNKILNPNFFLDDRSYSQLLIAGKSAADTQKDYTIGTMELYRAIIKYLQETDVIVITRNMTPNEVAQHAISSIPQYKKGIIETTNIFNRIFYGIQKANEKEYNITYQLLLDITSNITPYEKSYEGFGYGGIH